MVLRSKVWLAALLLLLAAGGLASKSAWGKDAVGLADENAPDGEKEKEEDVPPPPKDLEPPAKLIETLLNGDFDARTRAIQRLEYHGEAARAELEKTLKETDDLEVQETVTRLLGLLLRAAVTVEVLDRNGKPIPGAEGDVSLYDLQSGQIMFGRGRQRQQKQVTANAEGRALVDGLKPGVFQFNVNWKNVLPGSRFRYFYQVVLEKGENRLQYIMSKGGKLTVTVLAADTGKPLDGAQVSLVTDHGISLEQADMEVLNDSSGILNPTSSGNTDAKGVAVLEKVPQGVWTLLVRHDEYVPGVRAKIDFREGQETVLAEPFKLEAKATALGGIKLKFMDGDKPLKKSKVTVDARRETTPAEKDASRMWQNMRMQWGMRHEMSELETDDDGIVELKDRRPGKYRIMASRQGQFAAVLKGVEVVAGKQLEVLVPKAGPAAKLGGRVVNAEGKGMPNIQVQLVPLEDIEVMLSGGDGLNNFQNLFWHRRNMWGQRSGEQVATNAEGKYEFRNVVPGSCAVIFTMQQGRMGLIWDVKAEEGKTAVAPDLAVADAAAPKAGTGRNLNLAGTVLSHDGKPLEGGQLNMHYRYMGGMGSGSWGSNIGKDGKFSFNRSFSGDDFSDMEPYRLTVAASGCKPKSVDLTKERLNLTALEIKMEKQSHGQARITVTDEGGKPVKGAIVNPAQGGRTRHYGRQQVSRAKATNDKGDVYFTGLATGLRTFMIEADGYYLDAPATLEIKADSEAAFAVKMRAALVLSGKVELPEGFDPARVVLGLQLSGENGQRLRTSGLNAEGRYRFPNLMPGKHVIFTNHPCLALASPGLAELKDAHVDLPVRFVAPGGMRVELGPAYAKAGIWTTLPRRWDPSIRQANDDPYGGGNHSAAGDSGVAEIFGVAPGTYDLVVTPSQNPYSYRGRAGRARLVVKDVAVPAWDKGQDALAVAPAVKVAIPEGGVRVNGRLQYKGDWKAMQGNNNFGNVTLHLVGEHAVAAVSFGLPHELSKQRAPIVIGKPPEDLMPAQPGIFTFEGMPPGEYRLYAQLALWNRSGRMARFSANVEKQEAPLPQLIKQVTIEAGKPLDLGEVNFEVPPEQRDQVMQNMDRQFEESYGYGNMEIGEDEPEVVRP